jgi:hypothetical protein
MTSLNSIESEAWEPCPELLLAHCYHPELTVEHPAFGRLPALAQWALNELERQDAKWGHKPYFRTRGGLPNTRIAILNDYHRTSRLLTCMMVKNKYGPGFGRCGLIMCPYCQYLKGQLILKKYGRAWSPDCWHWLVISIKGFINLSECQAKEVVDFLDALRSSMKRWKHTVGGVAGWEELSVHSFVPYVLCTPHTNNLVYKQGDLDLDLLGRIIAEELKARGLSVQPDIEPRRPRTEAHFYEMLEYCKPIDLVTPYNSAFWAAKDTADLERLHEGVRTFFQGYAEIITEYRRRRNRKLRRKVTCLVARTPHFYFGDCHGSANKPLGIKKEERQTKEHQRLINNLKLNANEDEMGQTNAEENHLDIQPEDL